MPGQYAIVRPGIQPNDGDICAVWVEGEGGTLKRIFREGSRIRLVPSNPKYSEATYPADKVIIQGILIASVNIWRFRER